MEFKLHSEYKPTGDQPEAIEKLVKGFKEGNQFMTLKVVARYDVLKRRRGLYDMR